MEYFSSPLARSGVSRITFGGAALGLEDHGDVDIRALRSAVDRAIDMGINCFDTADCYGLGKAESNLAEFLHRRRESVVIATKFGVRWTPRVKDERVETRRDNSPAWLATALENSLERLRLETIPLYFVHWPDGKTPVEEVVGTLERCKAEGKIQHIGLSNFSAAQIETAAREAPIAAVECSYNLLNRKESLAIVETCKHLEIPVFCYGVLAQGLFSGKYRKHDFPANDRRNRLQHFRDDQVERTQELVNELAVIAQRHNVTPSQVAIQWTLRQPGVQSVIIGAKNQHQVDDNCGALAVTLSRAEIDRLTQLAEQTELSAPAG